MLSTWPPLYTTADGRSMTARAQSLDLHCVTAPREGVEGMGEAVLQGGQVARLIGKGREVGHRTPLRDALPGSL